MWTWDGELISSLDRIEGGILWELDKTKNKTIGKATKKMKMR